MKISVVSGTHNRLKYLIAMMDSARQALPPGFPIEFVIVDAGSTDGTLSWLRSQPNTILIEHGERRGAITAFTEGARRATGKYVVLANDDVVFVADSIIRAAVYLENTKACGAVAFEDNRAIPPYYKGGNEFHVAQAPAIVDERDTYLYYAQVGMFRKWLGDELNWWRGNNRRFAKARTYGGDNMLSSNIWAAGYSVDRVEGCRVVDEVVDDELRSHNGTSAQEDSSAYYRVFPKGPTVPPYPHYENPDRLDLRLLYLPIYEPGYPIQKKQKRGLRDAFIQRGAMVYEVDYHRYTAEELRERLLEILTLFQPHLMLMQCHGPGLITINLMDEIRRKVPRMVVYNWNGDYWPDGLTGQGMLELMRYIDLQMVVNTSVLDTYHKLGFSAAYWQIGFEDPSGEVPEVPAYDVVFLANAYKEERLALGRMLRGLAGVKVGLIGQWPDSDGHCLYDFLAGKAYYNHAKIAIGDNMYPDAPGFVSNRLFQALAAGGALYMQQHIEGLEALTGLIAGVHYVEWKTPEELEMQIKHFLKHEQERVKIAEAGTKFTRENHSFAKRVQEFFSDLIPMARRAPRVSESLVYIGRRTTAFGERGPQTGYHYQAIPGKTLYVDPLDADALIASGHWKKIETLESEALIR